MIFAISELPWGLAGQVVRSGPPLMFKTHVVSMPKNVYLYRFAELHGKRLMNRTVVTGEPLFSNWNMRSGVKIYPAFLHMLWNDIPGEVRTIACHPGVKFIREASGATDSLLIESLLTDSRKLAAEMSRLELIKPIDYHHIEQLVDAVDRYRISPVAWCNQEGRKVHATINTVRSALKEGLTTAAVDYFNEHIVGEFLGKEIDKLLMSGQNNLPDSLWCLIKHDPFLVLSSRTPDGSVTSDVVSKLLMHPSYTPYSDWYPERSIWDMRRPMGDRKTAIHQMAPTCVSLSEEIALALDDLVAVTNQRGGEALRGTWRVLQPEFPVEEIPLFPYVGTELPHPSIVALANALQDERGYADQVTSLNVEANRFGEIIIDVASGHGRQSFYIDETVSNLAGTVAVI